MADCLTAGEIEGLLAGRLTPHERARVETHLAGCEKCREELKASRSAGQVGEGFESIPCQETATIPAKGSPAAGDESSSSTRPPIQEPIEGYEILSEIHRGGQGVVYKAVQKSTKRTVALKVLPAGPYASPRQRHRFQREISLAAGLRHPNIVTVYESGLARERYYFAMEYIHGQPLDAYLSEKKLPLDEFLQLMVSVCRAVGYAHHKGVVHRDLKPGNILVDAEGQPHIVDFGLAKAAGTGMLEDVPVTVTSEFTGTLAFASPEQVRGDPSLVDVRTDIYSLGVILYRALAGRHPYDVTGELSEVLRNISEAEPKKPSAGRRELKGDLDTVVLKALAKEKERRYQSAGELAEDLQRVLRGEPIEARSDSVTYVVGKRCRALARRHPVVSMLGVLVLVVLITQTLGVALIFRWTRIDHEFERRVTLWPSPAANLDAFDQVRIIGLTDETNVVELAERENLAAVTPQDLKSLRRLHGRLMEKLADAHLRVLVWHIAFCGETEFDDDFVKGVGALQGQGVPVIVGVPTWQLDDQGLPELSKTIALAVRWGHASARFGPEAPWNLELVMSARRGGWLSSLALVAAAAYRQPTAEVDPVLDKDTESVELRYWRRNPRIPQAKIGLGLPSTHIPLSAVREEKADDPQWGLRRGDRIGYVTLNIPPEEVLAASTIEYAAAFTASQEQLQTWLGDKVVMVTDLRSGIPPYGHPDGRMLAGCYGHAAAVDGLLRTSFIRRPGLYAEYTVITAGAVLGLLSILVSAGRPITRFVILALLAAALVVVSLGAYRAYQYLCNPLVPVFAMLLACGLVAGVNRVRTIRR